MKQDDISSLFLAQFVAAVLIAAEKRNTKKQQTIIPHTEIKKEKQQPYYTPKQTQSISSPEIKLIPSILQNKERPINLGQQNQQPKRSPPEKNQVKSQISESMQLIPITSMHPRVVRISQDIPLPSAAQTPQIRLGSLKKIESILNDPTVQSIECTGPEKPLLLNQGGITRSAPVRFTKEEIDAILQEASKKTRIPLTGGIFTAALGDIIMSAVISDFIGSRFIIEHKKSPVLQPSSLHSFQK